MSNIDNEGLRTLDQIRADASLRLDLLKEPIGTMAQVHPGELERIEQKAGNGDWINPLTVLSLVNTVRAMSKRGARRLQQLAQARHDAAQARERAEKAEALLQETRADMFTSTNRKIVELESEVDRYRQRAEIAERRIEEYTRDAMQRIKVLDRIRQRFGIEPGGDLIEDLSRKVGDLQTSEAELVSAPLKARVTELEQSVQARDRLLESATRELWDRANRLEQLLDQANDGTAKLRKYAATLEDSIKIIREAVNDQNTVAALIVVQDRPANWPAASTLVEVIKRVQEALPPED